MLANHITAVKRQVDHYTGELARFTPDHPRYRPDKVVLYRRIVDDLTGVLEYLLERQRRATARQIETGLQASADVEPPPRRGPLPLTPTPGEWPAPPAPLQPSPAPRSAPPPAAGEDDLSDLPPELLKELSDSAKGEKDLLIKLIDERGGTATLDEILIDLWRKHKEIGKRPIIANRLYRLGRRKLVWAASGKKGVYTTIKPEGASSVVDDDNSADDEGPDAATSGPSIKSGVAGSPERPSKPAPVGSTPTASTAMRRKLLSETSLPNLWPQKEGRR